MSDETAVKDILLDEYRFMQKSYELQFTHFMGVFYIWIPLVSLPVGAGVLSNLGSKPLALGFLLLFIGVLGFLVSAKMFDIRGAQIRYLKRTNELREALWKRYDIQKETQIEPLGKGVDLVRIARTDFGLTMALTMSAVHGVLIGVGIWNVLRSIQTLGCGIYLAIFGGVIFAVLNIASFLWIVGRRPRVS